MSWLLIHGGGATGRFWDRLAPLLDGPVLAPDLPGRRPTDRDRLVDLSVDDEVASLLDAVATAGRPDPITVVAHSSGGLTVPGVVSALGDRVAAIVLNAAAVPPEGGCGLDCMQPRHAEGVRLALDMAEEAGEPLFTAGPPADPEKFRNAYGEPLDDDTLAYVVDPERCVVDTMHHYLQPVRWSTVPPSIPVTYLLTERDRPVPAPIQEEMVGRLPTPPTLIRLDTGHIPPVTDPTGFAALLRNAT